MYTLYYVVTDRPTFPVRGQLKAAGCSWDGERKQWYSQDSSAAARAAALVSGSYIMVEANTLPPKPKPRGRPFSRGADPRRNAEPTTAAEPTEPTAEPVAAVASNNGNAADQFAALIRQMAAGAVDAAKVREIVSEELEPLASALEQLSAATVSTPQLHDVRITVDNLPPVQIGLAHRDLERIVRRLSIRTADGRRRFANVRVVGPAGSGKTTVAEQVARALGLAYVYMSATRSMPESRLEGKRIQNIMTGEERYIPSTLVEAYTAPTLYLLDEADNLDGSAAVCVNMATGNGHWALQDGRVLERHPDMVFMLAMNTWGNGQDRMYMREQQDAAFLDRFSGASFFLDYDPAVEAAVAPRADVRERFDAIRKAASGKVRRVLSTRMLAAAHDILIAEGGSVDDALRQVMPDWTAADLSAVGL